MNLEDLKEQRNNLVSEAITQRDYLKFLDENDGVAEHGEDFMCSQFSHLAKTYSALGGVLYQIHELSPGVIEFIADDEIREFLLNFEKNFNHLLRKPRKIRVTN